MRTALEPTAAGPCASPTPPADLMAKLCCLADYGATLHASSADGTDFSSRAH